MGKVISGRNLLFDFDVELTLVAMKLIKKLDFLSFSARSVQQLTSAVTVTDAKVLPTGYAIDFTDVR